MALLQRTTARRAKQAVPARGRRGTLDEYNERRDFKTTSEPRGERGRETGQRFVVQKHDARRLHYDLRLEHKGVLKSFAVTRGPSLVPGDKRLAVQTEDHPLKYLDFEGTIPRGEYGGGTMIVWDQGIWTPDGDPERGFAKGHIHFTLKGERLHGGWHLVRMRQKAKEKRTNWLLIKTEDEAAQVASSQPLIDREVTSIKTRRTNKDLEKDLQPARRAEPKQAVTRRGKIAAGRKAAMPDFVQPQLAQLVSEAPNGTDWLHEIKFDGYRVQARCDGARVKLLTRKGLDWTGKFQPVADALKEMKLRGALLDGEIVVEDGQGRSSFSALQKRLSEGGDAPFVYNVFDLLHIDDRDIRARPLGERKELLSALLKGAPANGTIRFSDHLDTDGAPMVRHACRLGLEGIVSKRTGAPYRSGRSDDWRKTKCTERQELVIAGYAPSSVQKSAIGSLVMAVYDKGELVHVGRSGTGYTADMARALMKRLKPLAIDKPLFKAKLDRAAAKDVVWVRPKLVAEVEMHGFTHDGLIRHAAFKGLREDKDAEDVVRETPKTPNTRSKPGAALKVKLNAGKAGQGEYDLTHPDRVYWPDTGLTKLGLAEFYDAIGDHILPHIAGRALALVRCPGGVEEQCFFQKHGWEGMPKAIYTKTVDGDEWVYIKDKAGLLALVQSGCLEIHPWGSLLRSIEKPDRIILDFDPGPGVGWDAVVAAAVESRQRLKAYGLESFVKTSGGKGLHVCAPLTPRRGWDEVKDFTRRIAEAMAADSPDAYVANMAKSKRQGKIFVDYLRNGRGSTAVAAFSTRARPGAAVSTPIAWSELGPDISPTSFTVENLAARLAHMRKDPWAGFLTLKQTIKLPRAKGKAGTERRKPKATYWAFSFRSRRRTRFRISPSWTTLAIRRPSRA